MGCETYRASQRSCRSGTRASRVFATVVNLCALLNSACGGRFRQLERGGTINSLVAAAKKSETRLCTYLLGSIKKKITYVPHTGSYLRALVKRVPPNGVQT